MKPYTEVPDKFTKTFPNQPPLTIDNTVRMKSGLAPIVAWPADSVYIFSAGDPDRGEFLPKHEEITLTVAVRGEDLEDGA